VRPILNILAIAAVWFAVTAEAAHTHARLILSASTARAGETVVAGIHLRMDPEWHTYWKNSGASGIPTTIEWELPEGVTAGDIQWPVPEKLPPNDLVTYIYENEVVLLVPLQLASNLPAGTIPITANVAWLECKEQCLPGDAQLQANLTLSESAATPSADAALISQWKDRLPLAGTNLNVQAHWEKPVSEKLRPVVIEWSFAESVSEADFYPYASDSMEVQGSVERIPAANGKVKIRKLIRKLEGDWPASVSGLLIHKTDEKRAGYDVTIPITATESTSGSGAVSSPSNSEASKPLWQILLFAFLGGMLLNIMPCVLPVIALKILGFVSEARSEPARVKKLGLIYGAGVLVSFIALAALAIGLKAGWGAQFGNPIFLVVLTVLVTLLALSLFGVFEINLGAKVMGSAGTLASMQGSSGAFFNGVLATVLATPCTAPFLGTALGFALTQPAPVVLLIFLTVGVGLAFPYVVLSFQPAWLRFIPKPGKWMERFKVAMGFPMLATAVWLFSLTQSHYGKRFWWLALFLVVVSLCAWIYGEFVQRAANRHAVGRAAAIIILLAGYGYILERELDWRHSTPEQRAIEQSSADGIAWEAWSPEAVTKAQEAGRPVLVDFTADWCLTCQANKKFALEVDSVRAKLQEMNVLSLLGDYTLLPKAMRTELNRYGRDGVPLVLIFPGKPGAPPEVLPETLTPGIVLGALERARQKNS
jgi:Thiol:disulfide interchange protein